MCFISETPMSDLIKHFVSLGITIEEGPVQKVEARGPIISIYFRDPDGNLIELSNYLK